MIEKIIESVVGEVRWSDCRSGSRSGQRVGYIKCPGHDLHTSTTNLDHTAIFFEHGFPFITCFHSNCRAQIASLSAELRATLEDAVAAKEIVLTLPKVTEEVKEKLAERAAAIVRAKQMYDSIITEDWSPQQMEKDTIRPLSIAATPGDFIKQMFSPNEIVWVGEPNWTGTPHAKIHFRRAFEWSSVAQGVWPNFTCPTSFKVGSYSRCLSNIDHRKYLVVEHDHLPKEKIGAIFKWANSKGLPLKAVVDSGNKSLHGWFLWAGDSIMEGWSTAFTAMGCDAKTMRPVQPVRLPGAIRILRDGRQVVQKLLYLGA